jgi:hypothetical protein
VEEAELGDEVIEGETAVVEAWMSFAEPPANRERAALPHIRAVVVPNGQLLWPS